jgi:PAS domain S-box-containing protein
MPDVRGGDQEVRTDAAARLADAVPDLLGAGACLLDERGVILCVNEAATRLLGLAPAEVVGQDAHDLLHRDRYGQRLPRSNCTGLRVLADGLPRTDTAWFAHADGGVIPVVRTMTPGELAPGRAGALVVFYRSGVAIVGAEAGVPTPGGLSEFERLALLAETTTQLTSTLDVEEAMTRLARLAVPYLADWVIIDMIDDNEEVWRAAVFRHEGQALRRVPELEGPMPPIPQESTMPLSRALRGVASSLAGPRTYQGPPDAGIAVEQRRLFEATGMHSAIISPIRGLREMIGALTLGRSSAREEFSAADLPLLEDIARRTGLALDNARLYQRQRRVAETMQRHLLPQLPRVPGLQMRARYLPAPDASQVGGDWYDAFSVTEGGTALVIGDVAGHDLDAAAGMAQLRNMLRAYAVAHHESPDIVATRLEQAMLTITDATMATLVFGRLQAAGPGGVRFSWTNAGHPPPLLITRDGITEFLTEGHGPLLGLASVPTRPHASRLLPRESVLLLYTDGLIESRHRSLDHGLNQLRQHAAALSRRSLGDLCDALLARVRPPDNEDDVALLALRVS